MLIVVRYLLLASGVLAFLARKKKIEISFLDPKQLLEKDEKYVIDAIYYQF